MKCREKFWENKKSSKSTIKFHRKPHQTTSSKNSHTFPKSRKFSEFTPLRNGDFFHNFCKNELSKIQKNIDRNLRFCGGKIKNLPFLTQINLNFPSIHEPKLSKTDVITYIILHKNRFWRLFWRQWQNYQRTSHRQPIRIHWSIWHNSV